MRNDADVASLHGRGELELSDRVEDVNVVDRAEPTAHGRGDFIMIKEATALAVRSTRLASRRSSIVPV